MSTPTKLRGHQTKPTLSEVKAAWGRLRSADRIWNYDPKREQLQLDQALMSRDLLAIRLGVTAPSPSPI